MTTPSGCEYALSSGSGLLKLCSAQIRKIAYIAPQNSDVDFSHRICTVRDFRSSGVAGRQRIDRVRRQYNQWVANQTLEDYALRFTAKSARRWSAARVANTALGAISFLALEAIGGTITLNYGVTNAVGGHPCGQRHDFLLRPADRLSRRQMRRRHRPADPRRRLRLYRLDDHVADLRLLHLHLLRHRGRHPGDRARDVLRHPAPDRIS